MSLEDEIARARRVMADQQVMLELYTEMSVYMHASDPAPAPLIARFLRKLRSMDEPVIVHQRELLHTQAAAGNEYAEEILGLLADDPWWQDTD